MKNIETPDKKHLASIIHDLREGKFGIPDFQRPFEWNPRDVLELIKSIFEDYYIGTLLLWKASRENVDYLSCAPIYGAKDGTKYDHIVLDGQQRLSALYYALFSPNSPFPKRKSKYYYVIYIEPFINGNYDEAFDYLISSRKTDELMANEKLQFSQKIFPLSIFGKTTTQWLKWLERYEKFWLDKGDEKVSEEREKFEEILESTLNEYYISYIELDREIAVEKVCDIFQRINSTGLDLNIFDLMNALLRPKEIKLKKLWEKKESLFRDQLPDSDKGKIYALQTMSILTQSYCAPKFLYYLIPNAVKSVKKESGGLEKIVLIKSREEFLELWENSIKEMSKALKIIGNHSDLGVIAAKFFPYPTMLPIYAALNSVKAGDSLVGSKDVEDKIRQWYWSSIFAKNYSSAVESQMAKDFVDVKKWFNSDNEIPSAVLEARKNYVNLNLENEDSQSSSVYKAVFCILIKEGAKDFYSHEAPLYTDLEDHHIVPQSWGRGKGIKSIDCILNRTPISDVTNKKIIRNRLPNKYIQEMMEKAKKEEDVYELFESHLVSRRAVDILLRENFDESDYREFIKERKDSIIKKIRSLVGSLEELEKKLDEKPNEAIKQLERELRSFIHKELKKEHGDTYWKVKIPGDIKKKIEERIEKDLKKNPALDVSSPRKKLDYIDVSEYCSLLTYNWDIFENFFRNKQRTDMHFANLQDFRNSEMHTRDKSDVTQKLGEAAVTWIHSVIK